MIPPEQIVFRLVAAGILGGVIGLERERLEWAAGMRTHALVCLGSALFMLVSLFGFFDVLSENHVSLDPSRVAAQVASGIGFIGAGTIIFQREIVRGLTTAASVWAVAAVGLAIGGGMLLAGLAATVLSLAILVLAKPLKSRMFPSKKTRFITLYTASGTSITELKDEVENENLVLDRIVIRSGSGSRDDTVELVLGKGSHPVNLVSLSERLNRVSGVHEVRSSLLTDDRDAPAESVN